MDKQYMKGALDMAIVANRKAGIETPQECSFGVNDNNYVFSYPINEEYSAADTIPSTTPLKYVFDWVEACQEKIVN